MRHGKGMRVLLLYCGKYETSGHDSHAASAVELWVDNTNRKKREVAGKAQWKLSCVKLTTALPILLIGDALHSLSHINQGEKIDSCKNRRLQIYSPPAKL